MDHNDSETAAYHSSRLAVAIAHRSKTPLEVCRTFWWTVAVVTSKSRCHRPVTAQVYLDIGPDEETVDELAAWQRHPEAPEHPTTEGLRIDHRCPGP
ncbi:hypothetical protein D3C79_975000 [compost metagenome]